MADTVMSACDEGNEKYRICVYLTRMTLTCFPSGIHGVATYDH